MNKKNITSDNATKLFCGDAYCIGIQGSVKTEQTDYAKRLEKLVSENKCSSIKELVAIVKLEFKDVNEDDNVSELNLTVSGSEDGKLYSKYLQLKNNIVLTNGINDEMGLRFNEDNNSENPFYKQALIYGYRYLKQENLSKGFKIREIDYLSQKQMINMFKSIFKSFDTNDKYPGIGGTMDYCIIEQNGTITKEIRIVEI